MAVHPPLDGLCKRGSRGAGLSLPEPGEISTQREDNRISEGFLRFFSPSAFFLLDSAGVGWPCSDSHRKAFMGLEKAERNQQKLGSSGANC